MNKAQLLEKLHQLPDGADVVVEIDDDGYFHDVTEVEESDDEWSESKVIVLKVATE